MLANFLYPEEKQDSHIFMAGGCFATWNKIHTKVRLLFADRNWKIAMFTFQRQGAQVLEKDILGS